MDCRRFASLTTAYLGDELPAADRAAWRAHLADCASCREAACAAEPTLAFAALPRREDSLRVERCAVVVRSMIRQRRLPGGQPRWSPRWLAAAAAMVLAVSAGLLWQDASEQQIALDPTVVHVAQPLPPPETEVSMEGEEIRVYQFATDGADDLAVTFVVNPAINL